MLIVETIRKIRCAHERDGKSIRQIAREFHLSRNTVKKVLRGDSTEFTYTRTTQPLPKLGPYEDTLLERLSSDVVKPRREQRTMMALFEEQSHLLSVHAPFDGFRETAVRVSTTSLASYDSNRYSVDSGAVGRTVMLRAYADRVVIVDDGIVIGEHRRLFGRHQVSYDPWHYIAVLQRKPGALRNGAPFKNWELPPPLAQVREALAKRSDGDRQFVGILGAIATYGLDAVASACSEAMLVKAPSRDVVLNILSRTLDDSDVSVCALPGGLPILKSEPLADCRRYDVLLSGGPRYA